MAQLFISYLLPLLLALQSPLFRFLLIAQLPQLLLLFFADGADLPGDFGAEVGGLRQEVGQAEEVGEDGEGGLVG